MPVLKNARHERFAQYVASGMTGAKAYKKVYRCGQVTAENNSVRLRGYELVSTRITELMERAAAKTVLSMQERRAFLADVVRADMAQFDPKTHGRLIQEITEEVKPDGTIKRKFKLPGKRECIMDDAKLAGDLVEKVQMEGAMVHMVLTDSRREELMAKKRQAMERVRQQTLEAQTISLPEKTGKN
jgi:phage terminase small subunit